MSPLLDIIHRAARDHRCSSILRGRERQQQYVLQSMRVDLPSNPPGISKRKKKKSSAVTSVQVFPPTGALSGRLAFDGRAATFEDCVVAAVGVK